jgi:hypothetical protein
MVIACVTPITHHQPTSLQLLAVFVVAMFVQVWAVPVLDMDALPAAVLSAADHKTMTNSPAL